MRIALTGMIAVGVREGRQHLAGCIPTYSFGQKTGNNLPRIQSEQQKTPPAAKRMTTEKQQQHLHWIRSTLLTAGMTLILPVISVSFIQQICGVAILLKPYKYIYVS